MSNWYIFQNNTQIGPIPAEQLSSMGVTPQTMVWRDGMSTWLPAMQIPELRHLFVNADGEFTTPPPMPGEPLSNPYGQQYNTGYISTSGKDKTAAGILAILLGGLGIQYFYLGKTGAGFLTIILTFCSCGIWQILTLVQGILMLAMSQEEFDRKYVYSNTTLPLF